MSDVSKVELKDIVTEFGDNGECIVPRVGVKKSGSIVERDISKRPRTELKCADIEHSAGRVSGWKEEVSFKALNQEKETMLQTSPWPRSSNGSLSVQLDDDSNKKGLNTTSEEKSKQCLRRSKLNSLDDNFCSDDPLMDDQTVHQPNNESPIENNLPFLGDGLEDKDSHDLLFYDWPDLDIFEDVDNLFRGCDSTFGLDLDDNNDMSWFTASHAIGESDDALKSGLDLSGLDPCCPNNVTEQEGLSSNGLVATDNVNKLTPVSCQIGLRNSTVSIPSSMNSVTTSAAIPHSDSQSKKSSEEKGSHWPVEDGVSYIQFGKLIDVDDGNHSLDFQHSFLQDNSQEGEISHQTSLQMPMSIMPDNSHPSDNGLPSSTRSVMKSKSDCLSSIAPRVSSHATDHMHSIENFHIVSDQNPPYLGNEKKDRHFQRILGRHNEKANFNVQTVGSAPRSSKKPICSSENETEGQSEVDGANIGVQGELDSCGRQESSCVSSVSDGVSVDASTSSLLQLQHVIKQLNIRTKLCIRDSLYRLAESAEQRHKCSTQTSGRADDNDANMDLLSDGTNKCAGFINIETDTNPIDRTIAHLLFHRPSDLSAAASTSDTVTLKSPTMIPVTNCDPLMSENPVYREETTSLSEEVVDT